MEKFKVIIIDDEISARTNIKEMLRVLYPRQSEIVAEAANYEEGAKKLIEHDADILFLDISLKGTKNGFDILDSLDGSLQLRPIFISGNPFYARQAFRYDAVDFLVKPIPPESLQLAVDRALKSKLTLSLRQLTHVLQNISKSPETGEKIILTNKSGCHLISVDEIVYIAAEGSYSTVYLTGGRYIKLSKNMKFIEHLIQEAKPQGNTFIRVHKSYTINKRHVLKHVRNMKLIIMSDGQEIPVTISYRDILHSLGK